jgi:hypothetical protein
VRLYTKINGKWQYRDYKYKSYTKASDVKKSSITSPKNGSTFKSTTITFRWKDTGADKYDIFIGTVKGSYNLYSGNEQKSTSVTIKNLPKDARKIYLRLWSLVNNSWEYNDYIYTSYSQSKFISKLFIGNEGNINYGAEIKSGYIIENINLIFQPQINAMAGSEFSLKFKNGSFPKQFNTILCVDYDKVGGMGSYSNGVDTISTFYFDSDVDESLIVKNTNITFHENSCSGKHSPITATGAKGSTITVHSEEGLTAQGTSFPDYNTNRVQIAKIR